MANEASYVPLGRDNTGAAVQLNPFDSSKIFAAYDKANAPVETPLLDSYGDVLKTTPGAVHPNDRPHIQKIKNEFIDFNTKLRRTLAMEKRDINAEEQKQAEDFRARLNDTVSFAQKSYTDYLQLNEKINANKFAYSEQDIERARVFPDLIERMQVGRPNIEALPEKTVYDIFKDLGTSKKSKDESVTRPDGSGWSEKVDEFDPVKAEQNFNTLVAPMLANPNSKEGRIATAIIVEKLKSEFKKENIDWDQLSPEDQSEAVLNAAKVDYMAAQQGVIAEQKATTKRAKQDKEGEGTSSSSTNLKLQPMVGVAYKATRDGKIVPQGGGGKGLLSAVKVLNIPIKGRLGGKNDQFAQLNKEIKLNNEGSYVTGTVEKISKYGDVNGEWGEEIWVTIAPKEGKPVEVLVDGENRQAIETEFKINIDELIEKQYPNWKEQKVELPDPTLNPKWNTYKPERQAAILRAYERSKGNTPTEQAPPAPTTPKEKGMWQKGLDAAKSFFTTTPAKTTRDPDEEFKRK